MDEGTCKYGTCTEPVYALGWCSRHWARNRRNGKPDDPVAVSWQDRFWSKVSKDGPAPGHRPELGPCWVWNAALFPTTGYGAFRRDGKTYTAHAMSYEIARGTRPAKGAEIDHLCRNRACVNPDHLEVVRKVVNWWRGTSPMVEQAKGDECPNGHKYTPETSFWDSTLKSRRCQICLDAKKERRNRTKRERRAAQQKAAQET